MRIQLSRKPFAGHSLVTVGDERNSFSFIPEVAGYVHQVRLGGRDLLANFSDAAALATNKYYFNFSVLPFPNRLHHGRYDWGESSYAFAINDPETPAAIHGFGKGAHFKLTSLALGSTSANATLRFVSKPDQWRGSYPFAVQFTLSLQLDARRETFAWHLSATNEESRAVPVGLCWHPYFLLPGGPSAWTVEMPPNRRVDTAGGLPTGRTSAGLPPKRALPIDTSWDDCFAIDVPPSEATVALIGPEYGLSLKQSGDLRYTQLFVPPTADSLAVEPMTCGVNAFRDAVAEVALPSSASRSVGMEIAYRT